MQQHQSPVKPCSLTHHPKGAWYSHREASTPEHVLLSPKTRTGIRKADVATRGSSYVGTLPRQVITHSEDRLLPKAEGSLVSRGWPSHCGTARDPGMNSASEVSPRHLHSESLKGSRLLLLTGQKMLCVTGHILVITFCLPQHGFMQ